MSLQEINERHRQRVTQQLHLQQEVFVCGEGNQQPVMMLVGEAPGAQEVMQGRPFVGKAGQNLEHFLQKLHLQRSTHYISNVVKIRPCKVGPTGRLSNRPPSKTEIDIFLPWLLDEIAYLNPQAIVTLGNTALQAILGPEYAIGAVHGQLIKRPDMPLIFPLYHPAAVIYNRELQSVYDADLLRLSGLLAERQATT